MFQLIVKPTSMFSIFELKLLSFITFWLNIFHIFTSEDVKNYVTREKRVSFPSGFISSLIAKSRDYKDWPLHSKKCKVLSS